MNKNLTTGLLSLALTSTAFAGGADWQTNMDDAMKLAEKEGKMLLIDFTGSDWCGWCIRLNKEVFSKESFQYAAPKDFVLVELDFPRKIEQTDEVKAHNKKWAEKYNVQGYPTIILADTKGEAFASTGYRPDGPEPYLEHLDVLLKGKTQRDLHLDAAKKTKGLEKARHLDQALSIEDIIVPDRINVMEQIVELDSDNVAELRDKYQAEIAMLKAEKSMQEINDLLMGEKLDDALTLIDQVLNDAKPNGDMLMQLISMKGYALSSKGDFDGAVKMFDETLKRDDLETPERQIYAANKWQVLVEKGDKEAAAQAIKDAIAIDPDSDIAAQLKKMAGQ